MTLTEIIEGMKTTHRVIVRTKPFSTNVAGIRPGRRLATHVLHEGKLIPLEEARAQYRLVNVTGLLDGQEQLVTVRQRSE